MSGRKREHLSERIRHKLGLLLQREAHDPRFQWVTVCAVALSKDQTQARISYSCLKPGVDQAELTRSLNRAAGFFSHALGRSLEARVTPRLSFVYDPGFDRALEMELLLKTTREQDAAQHVDEPESAKSGAEAAAAPTAEEPGSAAPDAGPPDAGPPDAGPPAAGAPR